jgi:PD-(D/E)XK endonuclease
MIPIHLEGAAREAIVKADLLRRGFEVYGTESGNCSFDIVAYKHDHLLRIEVKGEAKAPRTSPVAILSASTMDCRKFDILAVVEGNSVRYLRSILYEFNAASKELVGEETLNHHITKKNLQRRKAMGV